MGGEWTAQKVSELQKQGALLVEDGNHGEYRPRRAEFSGDGIAFIRAADMKSGRVLFESASKINDVAYQRIRKGVGASGDVILSHKGTVGKVALVPEESPPFVCSPQTTFWRVLDSNIIDATYLYAYMRSPHFNQQLQSRQNETDMAAYVSLTAQRSLAVLLPPIEEQRAIAHILSSLDNKIELNRQMNLTLEQMAQALFKSWFIDFDPVVYNAAQAGNPIPERFQVTAERYRQNPEIQTLPQHILDLFPDRFEDSELGEIPVGWEVDAIGNAVSCVGGATPSTKNPEFWEGGKHPFLTPKDMSSLSSPVITRTSRHITDAGVEKISSKQISAGAVMLSSRAPIGYLGINEVPMSINQGVIAMVCDGKLPNYYVLLWTMENMDVIKSKAGGTTFAEISKKNFRPIPALIPDDGVLATFSYQVEPLYLRITENVLENEALSNTRDALLPKLVSGELRTWGGTKVMEAAL